jgi:hypothetical protein
VSRSQNIVTNWKRPRKYESYLHWILEEEKGNIGITGEIQIKFVIVLNDKYVVFVPDVSIG